MRSSPLLAVLLVLSAAVSCQCLQPVKEVPCGKWNCPGCCDPTGSCLPGSTLSTCGVEAAACQTCIGAQSCAQGICRDSTCLGCIAPDGGCAGGESNLACGSGGTTCAACASPARCELKRCYTPDGGGTGGGTGGAGGSGGGTGGASAGGGTGGGGAFVCNANTCPNGCCNGNACSTAQTSQRCGLNGVACVSCTGNQQCTNGRCVQRQSDGGVCANCAGCCFQNNCFPGNQSFACGAGGIACLICANGTVCSGGTCTVSDGGRPIGAACASSTECTATSFSFCMPASAGWSDGYCTQVCTQQGLDPGCNGAFCAPSTFSASALVCLARCRADGGQGNCRTNYACQPRVAPSGATDATCQPRCVAGSTGTGCAAGQTCTDGGICL